MSPFAHCDVCAGNVAENSAYVMLSRVTSLQGLAFIAPPALCLLRRALDPDYMRFNTTIEDNAAQTYGVFRHLAPGPDTPVDAGASSGSD